MINPNDLVDTNVQIKLIDDVTIAINLWETAGGRYGNLVVCRVYGHPNTISLWITPGGTAFSDIIAYLVDLKAKVEHLTRVSFEFTTGSNWTHKSLALVDLVDWKVSVVTLASIAEMFQSGEWDQPYDFRIETNETAFTKLSDLWIRDPKSAKIENITKEKLLALQGKFTWFWGADWLVETEIGNFHWSDPDYDGDNSMTLYLGTYKEFLIHINAPYGRDKGHHNIERKCGDQFVLGYHDPS